MPGDFSLAGRVGNGLENPPDDVLKSKQVLGALKYYPGHLAADPTNIIDRPLTQAIYKFQRDHGLQQDGWMKPGGETEAKIREKVVELSSDTPLANDSDDGGDPDIQETQRGDRQKRPEQPTAQPVEREVPFPMVPPVDVPEMRDDPEGHGYFGADRTHGKHKGIDIRIDPGAPVKSPVKGTVVQDTEPYPSTGRYPHLTGQFRTMWVRTDDGHLVGLRYVSPKDADGKTIAPLGRRVEAGQVIGTAQDRGAMGEGRMQNHVHLEIRKGSIQGPEVDPTPWFRQWTAKR